MKFLKLAFVSAYVVCKVPFNNLKNPYVQRILQPILITTAILLLLLMFLIAVPFACYRCFVFTYLKLKHGNNFVKMLNFLSTTFLISEQEFATVKSLTFVNCDDVRSFEMALRDKVQTLLENVPELTGRITKCLGYYYVLRRAVVVDDFFSITSLGSSKALTEENLCYYVASWDLTKDLLFQIKLIKNPLKEDMYVLVYLSHHSIGDGHSIRSVVYKYLLDKKTFEAPTVLESQANQRVSLNDLYIQPEFFKGVLTDGLHRQPEGPYNVLFFEDRVCCVPKLKKIAKWFKCTFSEVVMALIMYNLYMYMKKYLGECPKVVTISYVYHFDPEYHKNFRSGYFASNNLTNNSFLLPFHAKNLEKYESFDDFINYIGLKSKEASRSMAIQVSSTTAALLDLLPEIMYRKPVAHQLSQPSIVFTNIGMANNSTISGNRVNNFSATMNCSSSGLHVAFNSCDNKLQIIMGSKLYFIKSRNELQGILDEAVSQIHKLCENEFM